MSHKLDITTVNVTVPLLPEERQAFGRLAVNEDRALGEMLRRLATDAMRERYPEQYELLMNVRRSHRQQQLNLETLE